ncbi:MAG: 3-isopropylmalate dehydratase large subunit [Spirochaetales bacterium]|nr:3-isopropylmalate dehydratase large subunit [Spirochaetales bacterium]
MGKTLLTKVWDMHKVATLPTGEDQLFIGLHLVHEVTSPQAFQMARARGLPVLFPERSFATVDHIVPTLVQERPFGDPQAEAMIAELEKNVRANGIRYFGPASGRQGIVHVIGPELGLTQPGMTIACGDSHTSTHGALGALALGIGTSQIRDLLATQTLALRKPKLRLIKVEGDLPRGVFAKDVILRVIADLGARGGIGYAYEYGGGTVAGLSMEERLTICNMSIEGGARLGYCNPDTTTFDYIAGRELAPAGGEFERAVRFWEGVASDPDATYDDVYPLDAATLEPMVTWGINPGQGVGVSGRIPRRSDLPPERRDAAAQALIHMKFAEGEPVKGRKIDVAFLGSCTNGRLSDLKAAAAVLKGKKIAPHVRALAVPGSQAVRRQAEELGLDAVFRDAGFEWRHAGCSMCLAMNPDRLVGDQICASSSNRNFIGRQGSAKGRTILMSPAMVAAAALAGEVIDVRDVM